MNTKVEVRLAELKREYQLGEEQLREIMQREAALRETLLRISGAIQVLTELLEPAQPGEQAVAAEPGERDGAGVLTVG